MGTNNLEEVRIESLPSNAYYISNFLSEDEERWILRKVGVAIASIPEYLLIESSSKTHQSQLGRTYSIVGCRHGHRSSLEAPCWRDLYCRGYEIL